MCVSHKLFYLFFFLFDPHPTCHQHSNVASPKTYWMFNFWKWYRHRRLFYPILLLLSFYMSHKSVLSCILLSFFFFSYINMCIAHFIEIAFSVYRISIWNKTKKKYNEALETNVMIYSTSRFYTYKTMELYYCGK